jgi:hypothetical protein
MLVEFEELKVRGQKSMKCADGKRRTRQVTFTQTINPWNVNKEGNPKTKDEIFEELRKQLFEWKEQPITDF